MAKAMGKKEEQTERWVSFRMGRELYAVNVMCVREVLTLMEYAKVAGAPDFVLGIVNLRGNVVTVIDAHRRFNIPDEPVTEDTRVVIIESDKAVIGMLVDEVRDVIDVPQSMIQPPPQLQADQANQYIGGLVHLNERIYILVDVPKLLQDAQIQEEEETS